MPMPKHDNGRTDQRYTVTLENTGRCRPQFVARFCGDWIGAAAIKSDAETLACDHAATRLQSLPTIGRTPPVGPTLPQSVIDRAKRRPLFC